MNTVGRPGRLGEQIRCVVSVSMLTEGWDTNTVTHILGVRAFGTQLLCEQVVGRGLRRQSYDLNPETGLFDVEYADIMGIPFDFAASPQSRQADHAEAGHARPRDQGARRRWRSSFRASAAIAATCRPRSSKPYSPRTAGWRSRLPTSAPPRSSWKGSSAPASPSRPRCWSGCGPRRSASTSPSTCSTRSFRDEDGFPKQHLFPQIQRLARRWLDEGYLVTKGVPVGAILYQDQLARAAEKIDIACTRGSEGRILAVLDPYNPKGSTRHVNFITSKPCWKTGAQPPKCHISHVVLDSSWEEQLALTLENHPRVLAYAKNQAMGFEIPYLDRGVTRRYVPDFLVRLDDGGDEPLNLVLEVKGIRDESDKAKAQTTRDLWVPGVNALGGFGRWAFAEFRDWAVMDEDFAALVERLMGDK